MKMIFTLLASLLITFQALAAVNTASILNLNTSSTNVTTSSYVALSASLPFGPSQLSIVNNTSSVIKIAYGPAGSEVDFVSVLPSSQLVISSLSRHLVAGVRLTVEAISATASSGYISVSLIP